MKVLISGAGIAGLTLAYWLHKSGHTPVVIEKAHDLRTNGYMIDFAGSGCDVANRMGLIPALRAASHPLTALEYKDGKGQTTARISFDKFFRIFNITDQFFALDRRDLVDILFQAVRSQVDIRFGQQVSTVRQSPDNVSVTFSDGSEESFDLLVGADGIHSHVRDLTFGPENLFTKYLGYYVAAFYVSPDKPYDDPGYAIHVEPNVQFGVFPLPDKRWLAITIYKNSDEGHIPHEQRLGVLKSRLQNVGWITRDVLDMLPPDADIFMDTVTQVQMPMWRLNRVVLIGDAAHCPTLISGQGASLAMAGAYFLAEELNRQGDLATALAAYETRLRPHVEKVQAKARNFAPTFVPNNQLRITLTNWAIRLMDVPPVTKLVGKQLSLESIIPAAS
ncbi:MAG: FAD-dependent monooxygenase [Anaerolineae bacterium]